jgi:hypothetical protein
LWPSSIPASTPSSRRASASLPSPQQVLSPLTGGFFLKFVKPRADYGRDVRYDGIPDIRVLLKELPEAFSFNLD